MPTYLVADTIAAVATPPGRGGVGIVRISGSLVPQLAKHIIGSLPRPRYAQFCRFIGSDATVFDEGIALYFPAPASFTGENILELQGHGGPVVMDMLLQRCVELGARIARPGEFSERAFLNNKLDLTQAEAIADLIDSASQQAVRCSIRSLQGEFSNSVYSLLEKLTALRVYVEASLDFPEEEVDFLSGSEVTQRLEQIKLQLNNISDKAQQGVLLREGMHLVILGKPNVGKSSLLNQLAGKDAAIVTHIPGTTRDVLRESIQLDGMPLHIVDTAGLRDSDDPVEQEGIRRAWMETERADLILHLVDAQRGCSTEDQMMLEKLPEHLKVLRVFNKTDLTDDETGDIDGDIYISARTGEGLPELISSLKKIIGFHSGEEGIFIARQRHLRALSKTREAVSNAEQQLVVYQAGELMAQDLRQAQDSLGEITGKFTSDDLLGEIFSSFCIGK